MRIVWIIRCAHMCDHWELDDCLSLHYKLHGLWVCLVMRRLHQLAVEHVLSSGPQCMHFCVMAKAWVHVTMCCCLWSCLMLCFSIAYVPMRVVISVPLSVFWLLVTSGIFPHCCLCLICCIISLSVHEIVVVGNSAIFVSEETLIWHSYSLDCHSYTDDMQVDFNFHWLESLIVFTQQQQKLNLNSQPQFLWLLLRISHFKSPNAPHISTAV